MSIVKIVLDTNISDSCWFQLSNLGVEKDKEYYGYLNEKGVEMNIDGLGLQLDKGEFVITETTEEISCRVRKLQDKGVFIKLIN